MLVCEVGAEWFANGLRLASNLSPSARSGSEGIAISSPGSRPASDASGPANEQSACAARFLVTEPLLKQSYWDTKFSMGKDAILVDACSKGRPADLNVGSD
jgi:hypothetical protein